MNKNTRRLIITFSAIVLALAGYQLYFYVQHRGLVEIRVEVIPSDSVLKVDGKPSKAGSVYVKPGQHRLEAEREFFDRDIEIIETSSLSKSTVIYMLPGASSQEALDWLQQHPDVQQQRESAGGAEAARKQALLIAKYPIVESLPYENEKFKIDYQIEEGEKVKLVVSLYAIINRPSDYPVYQQQLREYKAAALSYLKSEGVGVGNLNIEFIPPVD